MDDFIHRVENICKKQLIPLALICAMIISVAPLQAMALDEKPAAQTTARLVDDPDDRTLVKNWGFESGDLRDWTVLTAGWGTNGQGSPAGVVSTRSEGACEMPTNQSGSYHLSGLHNGIPEAEGWELRSSNFLLSGSGWISVKMGGRAAAVKVFLADGTQVGYYRQNRFHDVNYPYLSQGGSWNDMATYVMDLSEYLGKEMYVVLCDEVIEGNWANAFFDDVITRYDVAPEPTFRFDTVTDGHTELGSSSEVQIPWVMGYNLLRHYTENDVRNGGFESGDLTDWTVLTEGFDAAGAVVNERSYWEQELPYNQSGSYHLNGWNTGIPEEQGWAVRSSSFVLGGSGWISVKMGGNAAVTKVFLSDGTEIGYYRNFRFRDVSFPYIAQGGAWCDMATYAIDLSDYLGKEMYIELHDEVITGGGWANAFFDDVVTYYETAPDVSGRFDKVPDGHLPGEAAKLTQIPWVVVPKVNTEAAWQVPNGDFETGDLSGWTVYGSGFPIRNGLPAANSAETYWDQELPFNKSGNYFLNGWDLSANEASTWKVRSAPFTLAGSGWISVKMGGHAAAVRVYRMDGTLVGDFDQSRFCDKEFPHISDGGSWCEMATYLLDLTPHIGEVLYIELCDDPITGGWANAFFDDVVTYYPEKPVAEGRFEWVRDGHNPDEQPKQVKIPTVVGVNNLYTPRNGGFELGDLTGWTLMSGYVRPHTSVVAAKDYDLDNEDEKRRLPYNSVGNFILSGHDATANDENTTWVLRSSPFTLIGSGYISVKMGGHTSAFQVRTVENDEIIAYCKQMRFSDINFPYLSKGGSWRDMATYVLDLSPYLGQQLVIELMDEEMDESEGGWRDAYFDDIVTYYPERPTTKYDTVIDGYKPGIDAPKEIKIPWIYFDAYDDDTSRTFPRDPSSLKDISSEMEPQEYLNLYQYFIKNQGLSDAELDGSRLTFTKVMYFDMDGNVKVIIDDYAKLPMRELVADPNDKNNHSYREGEYRYGCFVAEYKFEQPGKTQTGRFDIVIMPSVPGNKIINGGFETGTMAGWTPLTKGFNTGTAVISAETYWAEELPYNQAGDFHLDGWNTGIAEPDTWSVKSINFILGGSGYISWRMGGNAAALSVCLADGSEIARVSESRFSDTGYPNVNAGHWADMGTYVMDLSEFLGEEMYIVLHDEAINEGWAHAFFDEVVTYYSDVPNLDKTDIVRNSKGQLPEEVEIPWTVVKKPTLFRFEGEPSNEVVQTKVSAEPVDLKGWLSSTTAVYKGQPADIMVTKVIFTADANSKTTTSRAADDSEIFTEGFEHFDMSRPGIYQIFYQASYDGKLSPEQSFILVTHTESTTPNGGFETGDLTGWTPLTPGFNADTAVISAETYWGEQLPYNQAGNYHLDGWNTGIDEPLGWAVRSASFILEGSGYISVRMGGNAAAVKVYTADGTLVGYYKQTRFKDAGFPNVAVGSWADMGTYVMDLSEYKGEELYIELCDEVIAGGWAHAFFDELVTCYETAPDWENRSDTVTNGIGAEPAAVEIPWQLAENLVEPDDPGADEPVPENAQIENGGFETGDLTGWEVLTPGFNADTAVISAETYWGEQLPYNQAGDYHLDGWNTGIGESDGWAVRSGTFKLQGSGYISVRMGGNAAAVKVYKAADDTLVGYYRQTRFNDANFPNVALGSWADMGTYVMDLSKYKGEELYIELHDEVIDGGWANAFFDEVVTYYKNVPNWKSKSDTVANSPDPRVTGPAIVEIPWRLAENLVEPDDPGTDDPGTDDPGTDDPGADDSVPENAQIENGGFETGDLTGWEVLTPGFNAGTAVISDSTYWGEQLPYNQAGDYHLDGWAAGIGESDGWAVRSGTFKLQGSGYISVRMGGNAAAVKVYKAADDTLVGYYKQTRFNDANFPNVALGSWADMGTYVMDLSKYKGEELYIELHDEVIDGGWANAFFDEVVTYYKNAPDWENSSDTVANSPDPRVTGPAIVEIPWRLAENLVEPDDPGTDEPGADDAVPENAQIENGGFETGDLTGWEVLTQGFNAGTAVISDSTYWGEQLPYNQAGDYHLDGWAAGIGEPDGWAVRSGTFKLQGSGYISVRMGGNAAAVKVYTADDDTLVGYYKQTRFNDASFPNVAVGSWADMGTYVMDLSEYKGKELYIELHDEVIDGGWAHAFFDEVVTYYKNAPDWENSSDTVTNGIGAEPATVEIPWQLAENLVESDDPGTDDPGADDAVPENAQIENGGFEMGDLTGWEVLTPGFNAGTAVISDSTYWGEQLPYNQAGDYHLDGWAAGIGEPDGWAVRSGTFRLQGSGYISVRMGGNAAAVKVYTADDDTLVGYYKQTRFNDANFPNVALGSWADMGTYVMDLSEYKGKELYIELHDEVIDGGWAHAFFDEVVTYYKNAPDWENSSDTVTNGIGAEPATVEIPWQLAENLVMTIQMDEIAVMSAYDVSDVGDAPEAGLGLEEETAAEETSDTEEETAAEETSDTEEETAAEETSDAEEETAAEETSDTEEETVAEETSDTEEKTNSEETSGTEEKTAAEEKSGTEEKADAEEKSNTDEKPDTGDADSSNTSEKVIESSEGQVTNAEQE